MTDRLKHPGGRPRLPEPDRAGERVTVRLTPAQAATLRDLGGAPAIRAWLDSQNRSGAPITPVDGR
jgi:hypothetical protein